METCFSRVTKRPACIYRSDLTPQPACRLPDFPLPFISGSSSIHRDSRGEPFFSPDPIWRDSSQAELGKYLACASVLPYAKGPVKEVAPDRDMVKGILYFFFFPFSSLPVPSSLPHLLPKQLTLARKRVNGFREALHLHIIKPNVITFERREAPSYSREENEGREQ